jgi:hypothetical protein
VPLCTSFHPRLEIAVGQLDDAMAAGADEMMVVDVAAQPVAELAGVVRQRVHGAVLMEERQRPVHGGQPDAGALPAQPVVELTSGDVVALARQLLDDLEPLGRLPDPVAGEESGCLIRRAHVV